MLAERGSDPEHDPIYFRFLLQLGALPGPRTLYEKFEALLADKGISIEFGENGSENEIPSSGDSGVVVSGARSNHTISPVKTGRRASFSSYQDTSYEASLYRLDQRPRRASFSAYSGRNVLSGRNTPSPRVQRSRSPSPVRETEMVNTYTQRRRRLSPGPETFVHSKATKLRLEPRPMAVEDDDGRLVHDLQHAPSVNDDRLHTRHSLQKNALKAEGGHTLYSRLRRPSSFDDTPQQRNPSHIGDRFAYKAISRPFPSQLIAVSESFRCLHLSRVSRQCFRVWHDAAVRAQRLHHRMDRKAAKHDRRILLQQALDTWRVSVLERRRIMETDRFYVQLERRAGKARDLYLLTKAFTHWAQLTHESVLRTSVARRHMLRVKYFRAWRDITAVNELKVRRFSLGQSFARWKNQIVVLLAQEVDALMSYKVTRTRQIYWTWFWKFCEQRAPEWHHGMIRRRYLNRLMSVAYERRQKCQSVQQARDEVVLHQCWYIWIRRQQNEIKLQQFAARRYRTTTISTCFHSWRTQARLGPIAGHVVGLANRRIASDIIRRWMLRTGAEAYAAHVTDLRVKQNAWTAWNDQLRCQVLTRRIDERVVLQTLYKWVLLERCILCRRLFDHRLKMRALRSLVERWTSLRAQPQENTRYLGIRQSRRFLGLFLRHWQLQFKLQRRNTQIAIDICKSRSLSSGLRRCVHQVRHVRHMHDDAGLANYFFLATKALRLWREAVARSRREKRKRAYALVRRTNKMSLTRGLLFAWEKKAAHLVAQTLLAAKAYDHHLLAKTARVFGDWRSKAWQLVDLSEEAEVARNSVLLQSTISLWRNHVVQVHEMEMKAICQAEFFLAKRTAGLTRRLSLLAFQYRNRERDAEELRLRNGRQHLRQMFRYWREKAEQKTAYSPRSSLRQQSQPTTDAKILFSEHVVPRASRLSKHEAIEGMGNQLAISPLPPKANLLPAYLATPPSRAARATALMRFSNTPSTPQTTPLRSRPRTQLFAHQKSSDPSDLRSSSFLAKR